MTWSNCEFRKIRTRGLVSKSVDASFFGYRTHLALTEERIITAAVVTTGEKSNGNKRATPVRKNGTGVAYFFYKNLRSPAKPKFFSGLRKWSGLFCTSQDEGCPSKKSGSMCRLPVRRRVTGKSPGSAAERGLAYRKQRQWERAREYWLDEENKIFPALPVSILLLPEAPCIRGSPNQPYRRA